MTKKLQVALMSAFLLTRVGVARAATSATEPLRSAVSGAIGLDASLDSPGAILSSLLPYLFTFGGIILLVMLVWGGFEIMLGATDQKQQEAGKKRITTALTGFLLLFASIWIAQLLEILFGLNILHNN